MHDQYWSFPTCSITLSKHERLNNWCDCAVAVRNLVDPVNLVEKQTTRSKGSIISKRLQFHTSYFLNSTSDLNDKLKLDNQLHIYFVLSLGLVILNVFGPVFT